MAISRATVITSCRQEVAEAGEVTRSATRLNPGRSKVNEDQRGLQVTTPSARTMVLTATIAALVATPVAATAATTPVQDAVSTFEYTQNMHPVGFSPRMLPLTGPGSNVFNSDITFWGSKAYYGTYEGFRIIDISAPANPKEIINYTGCSPGTTVGNQGDVLVWENLLIRSWNSPVSAANAATAR